MTSLRVNVDSFARAETARMFAALQHQADGVNVLHHIRAPAPLVEQPVIRGDPNDRLNRHIGGLAGAT